MMYREFLAVVRDRISVSTVAAWGVAVAAVYAYTNELLVPVAVTGVFLLTEGKEVTREVPGTDPRHVDAAVGAFVTALSAVWVWVELTGPGPGHAWVGALGFVGGVWLLLDARADSVQETAGESPGADDLGTGEVMLVMQHVRLVAEALEDGPETVTGLAEACDLTESRVREALEYGTQSGTFYLVDPEAEKRRYAVDERMTGLTGFGRQAVDGLSWVGRRLARPVVEQF